MHSPGSEHEWRRFAGIVVEGHRVASGLSEERVYPAGTIALQIPAFQARGLDLTGYFPATVNISIAPYSWTMKRPAHILRDVHWTEFHPPEHFSFAHCRLLFGNRSHDGLIYYPHPETKARHFKDPSIVEMLTGHVAGLSYGSEVELDLDLQEVEVTDGASQ